MNKTVSRLQMTLMNNAGLFPCHISFFGCQARNQQSINTVCLFSESHWGEKSVANFLMPGLAIILLGRCSKHQSTAA